MLHAALMSVEVHEQHTWAARLGIHVYLAECVGVDLHIFVWAGVCDVDLRQGAFEELRDGLWALVA